MDALVMLRRSFWFHHQRNHFPRYLRPRRFDPCFRACVSLSHFVFHGFVRPCTIRSRRASIADAYVRVCHVPHEAQVNAQSTVFSAAFEAHEAPVGDRRPLWVLLLAVAAHAVVRMRLQRTQALRSLGRRHVVLFHSTTRTKPMETRPTCTCDQAPQTDQGCRCTTHTPLPPSHTRTLSHPLANAHTPTATCAHSNTLTLNRSHMHSRSVSRPRTLPHARTYNAKTRRHRGTHTHVRSLLSLSLLVLSSISLPPPHTRLLYALLSLFPNSYSFSNHEPPLAQRGAVPSRHRSLLVFRFHMETRSWTLFLLPSPRLSVTQLTSLSHVPSSLPLSLSLHLNLTQVVVIKVPLTRRQRPSRS